jgi:hypothetical protein
VLHSFQRLVAVARGRRPAVTRSTAPTLGLRRLGRVAALAAAALVALPAPVLARGAPSGESKTVTAIGIGQVAVRPGDRNSNASIVAAVEAAEARAIPRALHEAREYGTEFVRSAGLTLGEVLAIEQTQLGPFGAFYRYPIAPFGANRYCGQERRPILRRRQGARRPRVVGFRRVRVCHAPRQAIVALTVTFAAS